MDTETTGLSGGAGTSVFLVGSAVCLDDGVEITQIFLADFPGEPEYLEAVHRLLWDNTTWVSYNGKAFDSRLLQVRYLMNGQNVAIPPQLDLLYWSRRLWKRIIGPCSLDDVEREVLRVERVLDVPGAEIPDRYFGYLRDGNVEPLKPVFAHHEQDILSLVRLFFHIERILENCETGAGERYDRIALGRHLADRGDPAGAAMLRAAVMQPIEGEALEDRERAAFALSRYLRNRGDHTTLATVWTELWKGGSMRAGVQLAKIAEHQERNLERALKLVDDMLRITTEAGLIDELTYRKSRLVRKLSRR